MALTEKKKKGDGEREDVRGSGEKIWDNRYGVDTSDPRLTKTAPRIRPRRESGMRSDGEGGEDGERGGERDEDSGL